MPTARIAKEAGLANGTLFNYFPTKQALIDELYIGLKQEVLALYQPSNDATITNVKQTLFMVWHGYTVWAIAYPLKHNTIHLLRSSNVLSPLAFEADNTELQNLNQVIEAGQQQGDIMPMAPAYLYKMMSAILDVSIEDAVQQKLEGKLLAAHVMTAFSIFWKGITP